MMAALESTHPHIALRIKTLWGLLECDKYIAGLLIQDRIDRNGFSEYSMGALIGLQEMHRRFFPVKESDIWGIAA